MRNQAKLTGRRQLFALVALAIGMSTAQAAQPIKLIVPFAAGGVGDALARGIGEQLSSTLGESVVVENRPGAGNLIGLEYTKSQPADGRTIFLTSPSPFNLYPLTYKKLNYDADKDFIPVAEVAEFTNSFVTSVNQSFKTLPGYIEEVKKNPAKAQIGVTALGSGNHMATVILSGLVGVKLEPVTYKGGALIMNDLMGGHLPMGLDNSGSFIQSHHAGKIKVIATTGPQRSRALPDVPTLGELGLKGFEMANGWYAFYVRAGTPRATVDKLESAFLKAAADPKMKEKFAPMGLEINGRSGASVSSRITAEREAWRPVVLKSGYQTE
ncbi:tripartite tricarboxylate transporter substrate-binding protein [Ottowia thiooxydans]|uniref:tripartite tricarboxylate transporter substrate-binding protein n=1 Tax=Ottowia thiooxydans TaxID=219182 RepID=UPI000429AB5D|nr:tripartite tricarboxylate transporter substrate-binding protein [Ottowia thiooxydans]